MNTLTFKSDKEIVFHLFALKKLALVDKKFLSSENDFIRSIASLYNFIIPTAATTDDLLKMIDISEEEFEAGLKELQSCPQRARLLIKDMIITALVDNDYCEEERIPKVVPKN